MALRALLGPCPMVYRSDIERGFGFSHGQSARHRPPTGTSSGPETHLMAPSPAVISNTVDAFISCCLRAAVTSDRHPSPLGAATPSGLIAMAIDRSLSSCLEAGDGFNGRKARAPHDQHRDHILDLMINVRPSPSDVTNDACCLPNGAIKHDCRLEASPARDDPSL